MNIDQLVSAISGIDENSKAELTAKLSAASNKPQHPLRSLRAARAVNPVAVGLAVSRARHLGCAHLLKEDETVSPDALDHALHGKDLQSRFDLKAALSACQMI